MITLDTNIYISALRYGGKPLMLLQMAQDGEFEIAISSSIIEETLRVLREKFGFSKTKLERAKAVIADCTHFVTPTQTLNVVEDDESDNRILECSLESSSEFIVTGDKHLLRLGEHAGIKIVKITEFLMAVGPSWEK